MFWTPYVPVSKYTYTGGPTITQDEDDAWQTTPADVLPGGGDWDGSKWVPNDAYTRQLVPTKQGNVSFYTDAPGAINLSARTNYFLSADAPATQDISLATGTFTLTVWGPGTVTSSAGTATGSGFGEASDGTPNTFTLTGAGTVTFTVAGGPPTYVNVEEGTFGTLPIITDALETYTRPGDELSIELPSSLRTEAPTDESIFGLTWNESTDAYARTDFLVGKALSASPGNDYLPIHQAMQRCLVSDDLETVKLLDPDNSGYLAGSGDEAVLDGSDGQVMVRIPKFYWLYDYTSPTHSWKISLTQHAGYTVHPAFVKGGVEVGYRYVGAYEGYLDVAAGNKLCSISGQMPTTSKTRAAYRTYAAARGAGWHQQDLYLYSALQLLYLIEYADFNTQGMIGAGLTDWVSGTWSTYNGYNPINATGLSNGKGNGSGSVSNGDGIVGSYMTWRGVENWYGHLWKFIDGLNIHNSVANFSRAYACQDYRAFADDTGTGYTILGTLAEADGYIKTVLPGGLFLPKTAGGSSATYLCDYYYTGFDTDPDGGWRAVSSGGHANNGTIAGAFCVFSSYASSASLSYFGGRLVA